ncbi:MAG: ornithine cyclodeaminase family protein [Gemmatimonadales bacterium]|nr:MAG: ornithine cyclodeaminase family protein [Gemmatimonadales bacterium]
MIPPEAPGKTPRPIGGEMERPPSVLFLDREAVEAHLSPALCLEAVEGAFRSLVQGQAIQPLRTLLTLPGGRDHFLVMPAHVARPAALGAKLLSLFPGNHDQGLPSHQGVILLFDTETGGLRAVVDAESVTSLRTAAASALATRLLAREDSMDLAILGAGVQARSHLEALLAVRPIRRVRVWSRTADHARAFVAEARARLEARGRSAPLERPSGGSMPTGQGAPRGGLPPMREIEIVVAPDPESAVRDADVICTVTASPTPILKGEWIAPGTHVNAVGAYTPDTRELDTLAIQQARFYVDRRESAMAEAGDFLIPREEGAVDDAHILGELGELLEGAAVQGRVQGRTSPGDRTVFKSLGLAVQDLAAVAALVREIQAVGTKGIVPTPAPSTPASTPPPGPPDTRR